MNNLYHYGVKGMKWGVRKSENLRSNRKEKLHLGIDDRGNLNLIRGKTTTKAKKAFAIKSLMFVGSMSLTAYAATHPKTIEKGQKFCDRFIKNSKRINTISKPVSSGIFSKKLGRELTIAEALDAGFSLKD